MRWLRVAWHLIEARVHLFHQRHLCRHDRVRLWVRREREEMFCTRCGWVWKREGDTTIFCGSEQP